MTIYADLGIRYYAVYLPNQRSRRKRQPLEVYALENGTYQQLEGNPVWLPEIGLGLGRERGTYLGREREWLYWFNQDGDRLLTPEERVEQAESQVEQAENRMEQEKDRAEQAKARAERLAEKLKALGVDPDSI